MGETDGQNYDCLCKGLPCWTGSLGPHDGGLCYEEKM
jgi:hypothetical protein